VPSSGSATTPPYGNAGEETATADVNNKRKLLKCMFFLLTKNKSTVSQAMCDFQNMNFGNKVTGHLTGGYSETVRFCYSSNVDVR